MTKEIEGKTKAESVMGKWAPTELALIETLEFVAVPNSTASVRIVAWFQRRDAKGWPALHRPMHRVTLMFDGVQGLQLKDFGSPFVQIMGFDIHCIATRGWEGASFEVEDYEDGRIRFLCSRVQVLGVDEARCPVLRENPIA